MFTVVSTRFNNDTWTENQEKRAKLNISCFYGSPQEMSPKILYDTIVFVVEMNNAQNKIEGIGLIKNRPYMDKYYKIHYDGNYNRFIYKSNYHINRDLLLRYNSNLVDVLDNILFKGKSHLKRGHGFTTITEKLLQKEICKNLNVRKEIRDIFITVYRIANDKIVVSKTEKIETEEIETEKIETTILI